MFINQENQGTKHKDACTDCVIRKFFSVKTRQNDDDSDNDATKIMKAIIHIPEGKSNDLA